MNPIDFACRIGAGLAGIACAVVLLIGTALFLGTVLPGMIVVAISLIPAAILLVVRHIRSRLSKKTDLTPS